MAHNENNEYNSSHVSGRGGSTESEIESDDTGEEMDYLLSNYETSKGVPGKYEAYNRFAKTAKRIKTSLSDTGIGEGGGNGVVGALYGHLSLETRRKTGWLSLCLFVIIGGFWLLDSLKDTVLEKSIGMEYQPQAKMLSVLLTLVLVVQYNRIVDFIWKPALFYVVGGCYTGVFTVLGLVLFLTEEANDVDGGGSMTSSSTATIFVSHPPAIVGWLSYVAIESYISVTMGLFWAYVNTSVDLEEAKACYGIIIAGAQIGAILGSTTATFASAESMRHPLRVSTLYLIGGFTPTLMSCIIWRFERTFTTNSLREGEVTTNGMQQRQLPAPQAAAAGVLISTALPSLPTLFITVSVLKSLTYSLGEPCKEMLYMVTSDSVKFKAKGWIDMFGSRCAKGLGSLITNFYSGDIHNLSTFGSSVIFCVSIALFAMNVAIGMQFQKLQKMGQLICSDDEIERPIPFSELEMHQSHLVGSDSDATIH
eukprot:512317_1